MRMGVQESGAGWRVRTGVQESEAGWRVRAGVQRSEAVIEAVAVAARLS